MIRKNEVVINFLGDISFGNLFENIGFGINSRIKTGIDPFYEISEYLKNANLNVANLESVISEESDKLKPFSECLRGTPDSALFLKNNNVLLVNLANNHTYDHGPAAFTETINILKNHNIEVIGTHRYDINDEPVVKLINTIKFGFLGYYIEETIQKSDLDILINRIKSTIITTRNLYEKLVLSLHWGMEYTTFPLKWQCILAKELADDCRVDVIYGHHPHTVHGVMKYNGTIIAPSLGNFIFDEYMPKNRHTYILQLSYDIKNDSFSFSQIPCYINSNFQPVHVPSKSSFIIKRNELLEKVFYTSDSDYSDRLAIRESKKGHFINRIKIRILLLLRFWIYLPYIRSIRL